jgi:hypothetical protein
MRAESNAALAVSRTGTDVDWTKAEFATPMQQRAYDGHKLRPLAPITTT